MKTLWNESARQELIERLGRLTPDAKPRWGKFNAPRMLAHIASSMRMAKGEIVPAPRNLPIRFTPLKQLIIYWLPFPRGAPTAPELLLRHVENWDENVADVRTQIDSFGTWKQKGPWPRHPAFGTLSEQAWGVLGYRHTDHHFKQFGV
ncbi:MAG TPA: hypothetical protein VFT21_05845 [Gemmatimonadaceae bacterium]|nr:hypothetical protein [Gemmatimonadaceae bacterium]